MHRCQLGSRPGLVAFLVRAKEHFNYNSAKTDKQVTDFSSFYLLHTFAVKSRRTCICVRLCACAVPGSASGPAWPPGRPSPAGPGTGSAGSAGWGPAAAGWSKWSEASWSSSPSRWASPRHSRSPPWACRGLRKGGVREHTVLRSLAAAALRLRAVNYMTMNQLVTF